MKSRKLTAIEVLELLKRAGGFRSWNAFAVHVGLSRSFLSVVLAGKREIAQDTLAAVCGRCGFKLSYEVQRICASN